MEENETAVDPEAAAFADALEDLKRRGCMLLVASEDRSAASAACERLLGESESARGRGRLFVRAGGAGASADLVGRGDEARVVRYRADARSVTASQSGSGAGPAPPDQTVAGDLADLHEAIEEATAALENGYEPGHLRVCLDGLDALVADHDRDAVFRFLHVLSATVRERRAMFHVHLPAAYDDPTVRTLAPLFDAVIEARAGPQQRWHLRDPEITTEWLPL